MVHNNSIRQLDGRHFVVHPPQTSGTATTSAAATHPAWPTSVFDAIKRTPALPTVHPTTVDVLCNYAQALSAEQYSAIELMARPLEQIVPTLREVFLRKERNLTLWGIGTIKSREEASIAAELRPDFLVSPAFSHRVLEVAVDFGIPYIPGVYTFQDVQNVIDAFDEYKLAPQVLKLCPAMGVSPEYISAMVSCFPGISFCPTGNITLENYSAWKTIPGIVAPMGSNFVPVEWLRSGDIESVRNRLQFIRRLCEECNSMA